ATYDRDGRPQEPNVFAVLWKIKVAKEKPGQERKPERTRTVRLQVDSPRYNENSSLNELKRKVIRALMTSGLPRLVREKGYGYDDSHVRTSDAQIQDHMSVTLFKILVDDRQLKSSLEETIKTVHNAVGWSVDEVM